jgi:hypothetical protein
MVRNYSSAEEIDEDELNHSLCSVEGLDFDEDQAIPEGLMLEKEEKDFIAVPKVQGYNDATEKYRQKADANVVSIRMSCLEGERNFATGDSVCCQ